jgi:rubrerythrin
MSGCKMVIIESGQDLEITWECSNCGTIHKATDKFESSKFCPKCGLKITKWVGLDDYEDDA